MGAGINVTGQGPTPGHPESTSKPPIAPRVGTTPPLLSLGREEGCSGAVPFPAAYQLTHRLNTTAANAAAVEVLSPSTRHYTATGLQPESTYLFRIAAQTRKGWGEAAEALVVTTEKRGTRGAALRGGGRGCPKGVPAEIPAPCLSQIARSPPASPWHGRRTCVPAACCCPGSRAAMGSPLSASTRCRPASCPTASGRRTPLLSATTPPPSSWIGEEQAGPK